MHLLLKLSLSNLQVPGILFTPICPHSLSFRPLILPEHVTLRVQVPFNSRSPAWASFDGKDRKQLAPGDALVCSMAPWPVPTACLVDSTNDFLRSIHEGLHWNLRKTQSFDGPRESWLLNIYILFNRPLGAIQHLQLEIDLLFCQEKKWGVIENYRGYLYFSVVFILVSIAGCIHSLLQVEFTDDDENCRELSREIMLLLTR